MQPATPIATGDHVVTRRAGADETTRRCWRAQPQLPKRTRCGSRGAAAPPRAPTWCSRKKELAIAKHLQGELLHRRQAPPPLGYASDLMSISIATHSKRHLRKQVQQGRVHSERSSSRSASPSSSPRIFFSMSDLLRERLDPPASGAQARVGPEVHPAAGLAAAATTRCAGGEGACRGATTPQIRRATARSGSPHGPHERARARPHGAMPRVGTTAAAPVCWGGGARGRV